MALATTDCSGVIHPCASAEHYSLTTVQIKAGLQSIQLIIIQLTSQENLLDVFNLRTSGRILLKVIIGNICITGTKRRTFTLKRIPGLTLRQPSNIAKPKVHACVLWTKFTLEYQENTPFLPVPGPTCGLLRIVEKTARVYLSLRLPLESGTKAPATESVLCPAVLLSIALIRQRQTMGTYIQRVALNIKRIRRTPRDLLPISIPVVTKTRLWNT
mmetsp:Transcript_6683/g.22243  ORF Transcript_6683/g.22243 Transcript_6683/m.22243 type:complete len:215 (+) Transcript_6683:2416-3060(+)